MRADRLVAIMMLLQKNGRTTAQVLAEELEVSERTIYRDVDALSASGIPVYTQSGPGGGIALLESYRTDLTGLTTAELQALLTLSVPAPLQSLGLGSDLSSALRKLAAAIPGSRRESSSKVQERIYIDSSQWSAAETGGSLFGIIREALWADFELRVTYYSELGSHAGTLTAVLRPLGLVAAAGEWFLVAERQQHTIAFPLANILRAEATADHFDRPRDFQLDSFWQSRRALRQGQQPAFACEVIVSDSVVPFVSDALLEQPVQIDEARSRVTLQFDTFERARSTILSLGNAAEVVSPTTLRLSVADFARQTAAVYDSE